MAFESLSDKLNATFKKLRGKGRLTETDVNEAMREVRLALLEADVSYKVVKDFVKRVSERAKGAEVMESLTPAQMVVKIVNEELRALMGSENRKLNISSKSPSVVMLVGLQGAGKTTNGAKLAALMKKQGKRPLLVAGDIYRPAAISQLQTVGKAFDLTVFEKGTQDPVKTVRQAVDYAKSYQYDTVILDTAGRLHIDQELMDELKRIKSTVAPHEILLTVDAMTGQDAVNVAKAFNESLGITGVILTKLDGDTRGGAALSVRAVTGCPIKFSGIGEKISLDAIEPFYPDRMASRILGMGDVLSLIEKAEESFDEKAAAKLEEKLRKQQFDLEDFLEQFKQMKKMGSIGDILNMLPGVNKNSIKEEDIDQKRLDRMEGIILSMTPKERRNPNILNASRRRRIAAGSGTSVQEVNQLIRQYEQIKEMMKKFTKMGGKKGKFRPRF